MNKLKPNHLNGWPIELSDLYFMESAARTAFSELLQAWGTVANNVHYVVAGCAVTDGGATWNIAKGVVVIQGEICKVNAHTITKTLPDGSHSWYFVMEETEINSLDSNSTDRLGNPFKKQFQRIAKVVVATSGNIPLFGYQTLADRIGVSLNRPLTKIIVGDPGAPAFANSSFEKITGNYSHINNTPALVTLPAEPLGFTKDFLGNTSITGMVKINNSAKKVIFTLPLGYRPEVAVLGTALSLSSDTIPTTEDPIVNSDVVVLPTGEVHLLYGAGSVLSKAIINVPLFKSM